ncbi:20040_t:CDS:2, partial [Gigaspora margarita]
MNNIICEVVLSTHGKDKINVYGYLMVKEKINDEHYLQSWAEHNYAADASWLHVAKTIAKIKEQAQQSNDKPSRIAQDVIANGPYFVYQYLPSSNAIRQTIQRIRHLDLPTNPLSLESLIIPQNMRTTLNGHDFLINDTNLDQDRILIFTTVDN